MAPQFDALLATSSSLHCKQRERSAVKGSWATISRVQAFDSEQPVCWPEHVTREHAATAVKTAAINTQQYSKGLTDKATEI
jgi:hypothetical protein